MTGYRYVGITDEQTVCDQCGREELKRTVIVAALDDDGNEQERLHFGTSCAARALAKRFGARTTAKRVLLDAEIAEQIRQRAHAAAVELLTAYGVPFAGEVSEDVLAAATDRYAFAHRHASWARTADWRALTLDMIERRRGDLLS